MIPLEDTYDPERSLLCWPGGGHHPRRPGGRHSRYRRLLYIRSHVNSALLLPIVVSALGFAGNAAWSVLNVRMENKVLKHIDALKEWADERYVQRTPPAMKHRATW